MNLTGPAEMIFHKSNPNEHYNIMAFLLPKVFEQLEKEFEGTSEVKIAISRNLSEEAFDYVREVFQKHGWHVNMVFNKPDKEEPALKISPLTPPSKKDTVFT